MKSVKKTKPTPRPPIPLAELQRLESALVRLVAQTQPAKPAR
jgi:hypothetical protein